MAAETLTTLAYKYIKSEILSGRLRPGRRVTEQELSDEIEISRTPVREAIRLLAMERLLDVRPNAGAVVRIPNRNEVKELFEIRALLEDYTAAKAAENRTDKDINHLKELAGSMQKTGAAADKARSPKKQAALTLDHLQLDADFHMAICSIAGNQELSRIIDQLRIYQRLMVPRKGADNAIDFKAVHASHMALIKAIEEQDKTAARTLMAKHNQQSAAARLEAYDRLPPESGGRKKRAVPEKLKPYMNSK